MHALLLELPIRIGTDFTGSVNPNSIVLTQYVFNPINKQFESRVPVVFRAFRVMGAFRLLIGIATSRDI